MNAKEQVLNKLKGLHVECAILKEFIYHIFEATSEDHFSGLFIHELDNVKRLSDILEWFPTWRDTEFYMYWSDLYYLLEESDELNFSTLLDCESFILRNSLLVKVTKSSLSSELKGRLTYFFILHPLWVKDVMCNSSANISSNLLHRVDWGKAPNFVVDYLLETLQLVRQEERSYGVR